MANKLVRLTFTMSEDAKTVAIVLTSDQMLEVYDIIDSLDQYVDALAEEPGDIQ